MAEIVRKIEREGKCSIPVVRCGSCRREVECDCFTNTCVCGQEYNFAGQHLAPRSYWGEETGERF